MSLSKFNPRTIVLLLFVLLIGAIRVITNFDTHLSPIVSFLPSAPWLYLVALILPDNGSLLAFHSCRCLPAISFYLLPFLINTGMGCSMAAGTGHMALLRS